VDASGDAAHGQDELGDPGLGIRTSIDARDDTRRSNESRSHLGMGSARGGRRGV